MEMQGRVTVHQKLYEGALLRTAQQTDVPRLMALERSIDDIVGLAKWNLVRWVYEINKNYVWLIELGQDIIYVIGFILDQEKQEIDVIKLTAAAIGKPLTGRLILAGSEIVSKLGAKKIRGRCHEHLLDFYKKMGFNSVGEIPNYFGVGIPAYSIERMI